MRIVPWRQVFSLLSSYFMEVRLSLVHVPEVGSCPKLPFVGLRDLAVQENESSDGGGS